MAKEGATVQIGYQGEPEAEVYLVAKNLDFNAILHVQWSVIKNGIP